MKRSVAWLLAVMSLPFLLGGFSVAPQHKAAQPETFSRRAMLQNLADEIILPLHETFFEQTEALRTAVHDFLMNPSLESLNALQEAWRVESLLWHQVRLFNVGRLTFVYHSRIANNAPIATQIIDEFINGKTLIEPNAVGVFGSNVVGVRTVEYLIFDPVGGNEAILAKFVDDPNAIYRAQYLLLTVDDLHKTVGELLHMWSPDGLNYADQFVEDDDPSSVQESISMLVNAMVNSLETTVNMTIGWALGTEAGGEVQPQIVEARYSGYSIPQITSFFEMLRDTFNGQSAAGDGLGFDDYLDFLGAQYDDLPLSEAINRQIDAVLEALAAIDEPLETALITHPELVQQVYDEGRRLVVLMKADMVSQLGITITFSDSDGD